MDFAQAQVHKSGNSLHVSHGDDSGLHVEFHVETEHQAFESEKEGRPVFKEVPFIQILFPGDSTKKVYRPATEDDKTRFPRHWAVFQSMGEQLHEGTPVEQWAPISKSMAATLKALGVHTVEQLAAISDNALTWLGARELREDAKTYLATAKDGAVALQLRKDNDNLKNEIEALKKQFAELQTSKK